MNQYILAFFSCALIISVYGIENPRQLLDRMEESIRLYGRNNPRAIERAHVLSSQVLAALTNRDLVRDAIVATGEDRTEFWVDVNELRAERARKLYESSEGAQQAEVDSLVDKVIRAGTDYASGNALASSYDIKISNLLNDIQSQPDHNETWQQKVAQASRLIDRMVASEGFVLVDAYWEYEALYHQANLLKIQGRCQEALPLLNRILEEGSEADLSITTQNLAGSLLRECLSQQGLVVQSHTNHPAAPAA